jgi:hypothetical protein
MIGRFRKLGNGKNMDESRADHARLIMDSYDGDAIFDPP